MDDTNNTNKIVVIDGLPLDITKAQVEYVFRTYGEVRVCKILPRRGKRRRARQGLVIYGDEQSAEDAVAVLHNTYKFDPGASWPIQVRRGCPFRAAGAPGAPAGEDGTGSETLRGTSTALSGITQGSVLEVIQEESFWVGWGSESKVLPGERFISAGPLVRVEGAPSWVTVAAATKAAMGKIAASAMKVLEQRCFTAEVVRGMLSPLPHWNRYTQFGLTNLNRDIPEFIILEAYLRSSLARHRLHLQSPSFCERPTIIVENIQRVLNPRSLDKFAIELQDMNGFHRRGCSDIAALDCAMVLDPSFHVNLNEVLLYHGAKDEDIEYICQSGFDPRRGGQSAGRLFGRGTYFAENFSKADLYSGPKPFVKHDGTMSVLVARVALGEPYLTRTPMQDISMPPDRPSTRNPYDSVIALRREGEGGCVDHREYVVYKEAQVVPMYRISYRHGSACLCSRCSTAPSGS